MGIMVKGFRIAVDENDFPKKKTPLADVGYSK